MKRACLIFLLLALPTALLVWGQQNARQNPALPTITFDRVWEGYKPQNVTITVQATGPAKYISRNPFTPPDQTGADPDYLLNFTVSARNAEKLFRDAKEANYFNGDFTFKKHPVATTGKKTLTYLDPIRHFETAYDYSENRAIQEITDIFVGISATIEHGRKLQFLHRFDKLGLEDELKAMENAVENHNLAELQIIAPTLQSIADDTTVLNIARQRAKRLLAKAKSE
jgi:hypothetical protein